LAKFNTPVVANGKVYVPTFSKKIEVYGLLPENHTNIQTESNNLNMNGLFPNPAQKELTIRYSVLGQINKLTANVVDIYGRVLYNLPLETGLGEHSVNIILDKQFVAGIYTFTFYADDKFFGSNRFIKN
jgi:hypothetical protein